MTATYRWLFSALGAALVVACLMVLFRAPPPASSHSTSQPKAPIRLSPTRADELAMRDLEPLFLPTRFNAAPRPLPTMEPGGGLFERDAVQLKFAETRPAIPEAPKVQVPATPEAALQEVPAPLALGLGRTDVALPQIPARGGQVEVFGGPDRGAAPYLSVTLDVAARPAGPAGPITGWRPLQFEAAVDATGLIGSLILTQASGVEAVDNHFRNYLAQTFRLGDRLPPGFYRVVVGP